MIEMEFLAFMNGAKPSGRLLKNTTTLLLTLFCQIDLTLAGMQDLTVGACYAALMLHVCMHNFSCYL